MAITDDLNLSFGTIRIIKPNGGHNGLKTLI
jgi:peptidyl-tRNA hydrolase